MPGDISGWGSWLPRDVRLMPSTAAATESSSELSVERAGAANEAFSIANSCRLEAPEKVLDGQFRFKGDPYPGLSIVNGL